MTRMLGRFYVEKLTLDLGEILNCAPTIYLGQTLNFGEREREGAS